MEFSYPIPKQTEILGQFSKKWTDFVSRFSYHHRHQNAGTKRKSFLLHFGADSIKEMLTTNQLSLQDLNRFSAFVEHLEQKYLFQIILCYFRYLFFNHSCESGIEKENYYTELKFLSILCSFEDTAIENFIKNHIINSLHDGKMKEISMTATNLTARDIVDICGKAGALASPDIFQAYLRDHLHQKSLVKRKTNHKFSCPQEPRKRMSFDANRNVKSVSRADLFQFDDDFVSESCSVENRVKYDSSLSNNFNFASVGTFSDRNSRLQSKIPCLEGNFYKSVISDASANALPPSKPKIFCLPSQHEHSTPLISLTTSSSTPTCPNAPSSKTDVSHIEPLKSVDITRRNQNHTKTAIVNSSDNSTTSTPSDITPLVSCKLNNKFTSVNNTQTTCDEEKDSNKIPPTLRSFESSEDANEIPQSLCSQQNAILKTNQILTGDGHEDVFTCNFCAYSCPGKVSIKEHLMQEHKSLKCFVCTACNTKSPSKEQFDSHFRTEHMKIEEHICHFCDMVFSSKNMLCKHLQGHTESENRTMSCHVCSAIFLKETLLLDHMSHLHPDSDRWDCSFCDHSFVTQRSLADHAKQFHKEKCEERTRSRRLLCKPCGIHFTDKKSYHMHKRKFHLKLGMRKFSCEICSQSCSSSGNLIRHKRIHTGEKPFMCEVCGKEFSQSSSLNKHFRIHTGEKPYKCQYCELSFNTSANRLSHERGHRQERPYVCEQCNKAFRNSYDLKLHIITHDEFRAKRFLCHCGAAFHTKKHLKRHEVSHIGAKPFRCELCGACFTRPENVKGHQKSRACQKRLAKNSVEFAQ